MLRATPVSTGGLYAAKAYKRGQLVCKMDKPKAIPVYTRDLSQYGAHVDSWESLRQSDNLPHSWVVFDKRSGSKSIKCVWTTFLYQIIRSMACSRCGLAYLANKS